MILHYTLAALFAVITTSLTNQYFALILKRKPTNWKVCFRWFIFYISQLLNITLVSNLPFIYLITTNILIILFIEYNYKSNLFQKLKHSFIYNIFYITTELLAKLGFITLELDCTKNKIIYYFIFNLFLFLQIKVFVHNFYHAERRVSKKHPITLLLLACSVPILSILFFVFIREINGKQLYAILIFLTMIIDIYMLILNLYRSSKEVHKLKEKNKIFEKTIEMYAKHIESEKLSTEGLKKTRHDLKNQLLILLQLSNDNNYIELEKTLQAILNQTSLINSAIANTSNPVVDSLVNYNYELAQSYGINFEATLQIPSQLPFADTDLCRILGNSLDNALEANIRSDQVNKYINLFIKMHNTNLIIIIKNSYDGILKYKNNKIITSKSDPINHGIGLQSITDTVNKYHGYIRTDTDNNEFVLHILLYPL